MPVIKQCATCGKSFSVIPSIALTRRFCSMKCKAASMVVDNLPSKVGAWTILRRDESDATRMVCRCDCGTERSMFRTNLYQGTTKSCGCIKRKRPDVSAKRRIDLTGRQFDHWLVLSMRWENQKGLAQCRCDCGTEREVLAVSLSHNKSKSCGCVEQNRMTAVERHGGDIDTYNTWKGIFKRCYNQRSTDFDLYGGRGVYVCERWHEYGPFVADVGVRPGKEWSIDRIDSNGGYTCGQCDQCKTRGASPNARWATATQQARNKRTTVMLTYMDETLPLVEWAERYSIGYTTLYSRIHDRGWTPEQALSVIPKHGNNQNTRAQ